MNQVRELLEKAAGILERDGHCKRAFTNDDGEHCAVGAIHKASADEVNWQVGDLAIKALEAQIPEGYPRAVMYYNDHPDTTTEDVLLLFKQAAASTTE